MPVYAYACKDCGHEFDIRQSFSDDALTVCPECGGHLRKKFNSVGVVFKGSGFYHNDSRADAGKNGGGGKSSSGSEASGGSSDNHSSSSDSSSSSGKDSGASGSGSGSGSSSSGSQSAGSKSAGKSSSAS
ncbi:hypothetical protein KVA01_00900 [Kocuria varians]|uniref:Putative regulatory protein FmdB zinc ribbon domain-containing protein n=1 Tax=Kocuria varians TaxID=1272 RepID=A0A4Y4CYB5_KOCVA|nr:FmdB family zinc ribbon protein [Kocuria varians]GEC97935.1 hypothetical protein KVA01_00900 [Kocuria varians]